MTVADSPDILTGPGGQPFVPIEEKHGDNCTCPPMGHIAIDLVAASRACPGDRNPHRGGTIAAQLEPFEPEPYPGVGIDITWPAPTSNGTPLLTWPMLAHDHATGEPLLAVTGLSIVLGGDQWDTEVIQANIKTLVDVDGQPLLGERVIPVPDPDDPERFYSKTFRCYVVEMRIRDGRPDLAKYEVNQTLNGTNVLLCTVGGCAPNEVAAGDDSLKALVGIATRHHAEHHGRGAAPLSH